MRDVWVGALEEDALDVDGRRRARDVAQAPVDGQPLDPRELLAHVLCDCDFVVGQVLVDDGDFRRRAVLGEAVLSGLGLRLGGLGGQGRRLRLARLVWLWGVRWH